VVFDLLVIEVDRLMPTHINQVKTTAGSGRVELIEKAQLSNAGWRAPRIHGELQKLGIEVSERTVSRILRALRRPPSRTWKTLLHNHLSEIVAIDFFPVPTIRLRVRYVFLVLEHRRRQVLHFGVTEHPTAEWTGQQVIEAFAERDAKHYLLRDRGSCCRSARFSTSSV
jgi:putative transposase